MPGGFTHVIVTAPNEAIANVYADQLRRYFKKDHELAAVNYISIADPYGIRVGSGGGTLNALDAAILSISEEGIGKSKLLVIHSGGDSRRAPLHSICGKAWTSLNIVGEKQTYSCPILMLIRELMQFCWNLPRGSMVVGCSDVLLDLVMGNSAPNIPNDSISVVVVPESVNVAKNHGVIIESESFVTETPYNVTKAKLYLQKPSVESMIQLGACISNQESPTALIDTGVVIITGIALQAFVELLHSPTIAKCTTRGLCTDSPGEGSGTNGLRLELYSDFLFPLALSEGVCSLEQFYQKLGIATPAESSSQAQYLESLPLLWRQLHTIPLYAIRVQGGRFCHLGTLLEQLELMTSVSLPAQERQEEENQSSQQQQPFNQREKLLSFAKKYHFKREVGFCTGVSTGELEGPVPLNSGLLPVPVSTGRSSECSKEGVIVNSYVSWEGVSERGSLIEHSALTGRCRIGEGAIVSHVWGPVGANLVIGSSIMAQMVTLNTPRFHALFPQARLPANSEGNVVSEPLAVLLMLGVKDDMKASFLSPRATVCGQSWSALFERSGAAHDDIWPGIVDNDEKTLWTARLFSPFLIHSPSSSVLLLQDLGEESGKGSESDSQDETWSTWPKNTRLSLSELLSSGLADPQAMFQWRHALDKYGQSVASSLYDADTAMGRFMKGYLWKEHVLNEFVFEGVSKDKSIISRYFLFNWTICLCSTTVNIDKLQQVIEMAKTSWRDSTLLPNTTSFMSIWQRFLTSFEYSLLSFDSGEGISPIYALTPLVDTLDEIALKGLIIQLLKFFAYGLNSDFHGLFPLEVLPKLFLLLGWLAGEGDFAGVSGLEESTETFYNSNEFNTVDLLDHICKMLSEPVSSFTYSQLEVTSSTITLQQQFESIAQRVVRDQIQRSLVNNLRNVNFSVDLSEKVNRDSEMKPFPISIARAPVRIDIAGGWSDTPPICYQSIGGSVLNVAIKVDGKYPVSCASRIIDAPHLKLGSLLRKGDAVAYELQLLEDPKDRLHAFDFITETLALPCYFTLPINPHENCSLIKACLVALNIVPENSENMKNATISQGLEVVTCSSLPPGSGMGGSSVLAAAILKSLSGLFHLQIGDETLVYLVGHVEQLMTTGGGWQDQVGSIYPGFKIGRSLPGLPLRVHVQPIYTSRPFNEAFNHRTYLIYTGTQRLAKNTLINALRGFALAPCGSGVVQELVKNAEKGFTILESVFCGDQNSKNYEENRDFLNGMIDQVATTLNRYWDLKKQMASGSEPNRIRCILQFLRPICSGLSLCGAGAGGYAAVILKRDQTIDDLRGALRLIKSTLSDTEDIRIQAVEVDEQGILVEYIPDSEHIDLYHLLV